MIFSNTVSFLLSTATKSESLLDGLPWTMPFTTYQLALSIFHPLSTKHIRNINFESIIPFTGSDHSNQYLELNQPMQENTLEIKPVATHPSASFE